MGARGCADPRACQKNYAEEILQWSRENMVPYLRERYPTVQWGGPADVVHEQFQAALAAEAEEEARRQGRPVPPSTESRGGKKPAKRQPLYDPGDVSPRAGDPRA